jgi:hypothetical protein
MPDFFNGRIFFWSAVISQTPVVINMSTPFRSFRMCALFLFASSSLQEESFWECGVSSNTFRGQHDHPFFSLALLEAADLIQRWLPGPETKFNLFSKFRLAIWGGLFIRRLWHMTDFHGSLSDFSSYTKVARFS